MGTLYLSARTALQHGPHTQQPPLKGSTTDASTGGGSCTSLSFRGHTHVQSLAENHRHRLRHLFAPSSLRLIPRIVLRRERKTPWVCGSALPSPATQTSCARLSLFVLAWQSFAYGPTQGTSFFRSIWCPPDRRPRMAAGGHGTQQESIFGYLTNQTLHGTVPRIFLFQPASSQCCRRELLPRCALLAAG